jgi:23S rRNA pseudouridine1911/1915/1917 synthase
MAFLFEVVFEDDGLLVVNKPADLVCHPTKTDAMSSLISRARLHLGESSHPQLVNRLDRETSGLVLIAKTAPAARELRRVMEAREIGKEYLALVHGHPGADTGIIEASLGPAVNSAVAIKSGVCATGAPARTDYQVEERLVRAEGAFACLRVRPHTGRKHQIRIHLAHVGHPIVGDKIYGPDEQLYLEFVTHRLTPERQRLLLLPCQALHAERLRLVWQGQEREFLAAPEPWFTAFRRGDRLPAEGDDHREKQDRENP